VAEAAAVPLSCLFQQEGGSRDMSDQERHLPIVDQIAKQYGGVIDLDRSPFVMVEILPNFGHALDDDDNGGGGGGGVGGGVSTIAVGITPPESGEDIQLIDVMRGLLGVQRDLAQLQGRVEQLIEAGRHS
jgi:hypothetical protein